MKTTWAPVTAGVVLIACSILQDHDVPRNAALTAGLVLIGIGLAIYFES